MRYLLVEKLGSGGMAEVFLATAQGLEGFERPCVLKRIRQDLASVPLYVNQFIDEARLSARLIHPHIVRTYDFGSLDGSYFLALEPVWGRDLRWMLCHLPQPNVIPAPVIAAEIARQCCLALEYAHALEADDGSPLDVVHRDVSPANIMVTLDGTVKLLDFGVAHAVDPSRRTHTEAGVIKGKMAYLAPEQIRGRKIDRRCDLFSLGVVLHELLTWRPLFRGEGDLQTIKQVLAMKIAPPSVHNRAVPPLLDGIVLRALERDPARRYQSAAEMADELESLVTLYSPPGRPLRRWMAELFGAIWREACADGETHASLGPPHELTHDAESCIVADRPARVAAARRPRRRKLLLAGGALASLMLLGAALPARSTPPRIPHEILAPAAMRASWMRERAEERQPLTCPPPTEIEPRVVTLAPGQKLIILSP
jgi:serine/threonine-protein kinase